MTRRFLKFALYSQGPYLWLRERWLRDDCFQLKKRNHEPFKNQKILDEIKNFRRISGKDFCEKWQKLTRRTMHSNDMR